MWPWHRVDGRAGGLRNGTASACSHPASIVFQAYQLHQEVPVPDGLMLSAAARCACRTAALRCAVGWQLLHCLRKWVRWVATHNTYTLRCHSRKNPGNQNQFNAGARRAGGSLQSGPSRHGAAQHAQLRTIKKGAGGGLVRGFIAHLHGHGGPTPGANGAAGGKNGGRAGSKQCVQTLLHCHGPSRMC